MRRKGEITPGQIDRGWPHQVVLPFVPFGHLTHELRSQAPRGHWLRIGDAEYLVICFADLDEADGFRRRMGGEWCPADARERRGWQPSAAFLERARLARLSARQKI